MKSLSRLFPDLHFDPFKRNVCKTSTLVKFFPFLTHYSRMPSLNLGSCIVPPLFGTSSFQSRRKSLFNLPFQFVGTLQQDIKAKAPSLSCKKSVSFLVLLIFSGFFPFSSWSASLLRHLSCKIYRTKVEYFSSRFQRLPRSVMRSLSSYFAVRWRHS